jgi:GNAT superfamily N-acetyltransferase
MKFHLRLPLPAELPVSSREPELIGSGDINGLADLMLEAYKGTTDYEGEGIEAAAAEIASVLNGGYGEFLGAHSFLYRENGLMVSAALTSLTTLGPLMVFCMTRAGYKRRGYARGLIAATASSLSRAKYGNLDLFVTDTNAPALRLYESLGFLNLSH